MTLQLWKRIQMAQNSTNTSREDEHQYQIKLIGSFAPDHESLLSNATPLDKPKTETCCYWVLKLQPIRRMVSQNQWLNCSSGHSNEIAYSSTTGIQRVNLRSRPANTNDIIQRRLYLFAGMVTPLYLYEPLVCSSEPGNDARQVEADTWKSPIEGRIESVLTAAMWPSFHYPLRLRYLWFMTAYMTIWYL